MNPGGWLEMQELCLPCRSDDGSLKDDSAMKRCWDLMVEATIKLGVDARNPRHYDEWMREAGFIHVHTEIVKWPVNGWPTNQKENTLGRWTHANVLQGIQGFALGLLTRVLGWSVEEVELLLMDVRKDLQNTNIHAYWPL
jgi:hypothetical protein